MSSPEARKTRALDLSAVSAVLWLSLTSFAALLVLYFVGLDQGATSVFGGDTHVHEFLHDARHLLGFPLPLIGMERRIIACGLLAGAVAGVLSFVFARTFVEPAIGAAIDFEERSAAGHDHGVELFTRSVQANIGMGFGVLAFGLAMGALFAVAFLVLYGRAGDLSARRLSLLLAAAALLSVYVVPFLKYPPNPPAVSLEDTIRQRTLLFLLIVVCSVSLLAAAVWLGRRLAPRYGGWSATLLAAAAYLIAVTAVMLVLPTIDETPPTFPADTLYDFRLYSLGTQVVMWAAIGLVFATAVQRLLDAARQGTVSA